MTTTTHRAVLCADGRIHYNDEHLRGQRAVRIVAIADMHAAQSYCGGAPHYVAEQTTVVSDWKPVQP